MRKHIHYGLFGDVNYASISKQAVIFGGYMLIHKSNGKIVLEMVVQNMEVKINFSEAPYPGLRKEIANILTAAYEERIQTAGNQLY